MGRIIGIDYGKRRIGLAISDEGQTIATPAGYIINRGPAKNLTAILNLTKSTPFNEIVCGLALYPNGNESPISTETRAFGEYLRTNLGMAVTYYDERYSSKEAEEHIRENLGIKNPKKVAEMVDTMAASMVLQEYLTNRREINRHG